MRVLFVNPRIYLPQLLGGVETTTYDLCRQLTAMGHPAAVMAQIGRHDAMWIYNRVKSRLVRRAFPLTNYRGLPVYRGYNHRAAIGEVVEHFHPDAIVISGGADESFELGPYCAATGVRSAFYFHELNTLRRLTKPQLLDGLSLIANSAYTASIVKQLIHLDATVIPPLVDRSAYEFQSTRRYVTMVNPRRIKGGQIAFDLAKACPDIPFVFVEAWNTTDPFVRGLCEAVRELPNVTWRKPTLDMRHIYSGTRVVLVPSQWEETWGRVVTEAHASGIPVLARAYAALPESVGPGGVLVAAEAPIEVWVKALRQMWDDKAYYDTLVARTREFSARAEATPAYLAEKLITSLRAPAPPRPSRGSHP
ncbi:MAG: glycosyltransferase [Proteobacteria bacterium]|nr:glycosyltransferase [Pseudomonadota bacterium]